jgi:hypothetical protein
LVLKLSCTRVHVYSGWLVTVGPPVTVRL